MIFVRSRVNLFGVLNAETSTTPLPPTGSKPAQLSEGTKSIVTCKKARRCGEACFQAVDEAEELRGWISRPRETI